MISLCILFCLPAAQEASAQNPPKVEVKEIVVTATRREVPMEQVGQSVTVLGTEEIERRQARDVLELLRDVPGLSIVQTGSRGGTTSLFVRGGEADYNLVMIDGVQVNRGGGQFSFASLTADNVERIEIVRGPTSSLYGSDAISSAINIVTKRGRGPPKADLILMAGSYRTFEERLVVSGGEEAFGYSFSLGRYDTNGLLSLNNDAENTSGKIRFDVDLAPNLMLSATVAYIDSEFHFPTDFVSGEGFPAIDPRQGQETQELVFGIETGYLPFSWWEHRVKVGVYDFTNRDFDPLDPIPSDTADRQTLSEERRISLDYRQVLHAEPWDGVVSALTIGFELESQEFSQNRSSITATGTQSTTFADEFRRTLAGYAQEELSVDDRLFLTLGVRVDDNSEFGSSTNPRTSLAYLIPSIGAKFRAAAGTGIKEPRFIENFGSGNIQGNPDLDPERSFSWETGADLGLWGDDVLFSATYFQNKYDDMISRVGSLLSGTFENIQEAVSYGLETSLRVRLTTELRLGVSYTFLRTRVVDDGGMTSTDFVEGEDLLRRPRHSGSFFVETVLEDLEINLSGTVVGPRIDRDFAISPSGARVRNDGYVKVDLAASYRVYADAEKRREIKLRLLVQNLLDDEYEEAVGFEAPGINALAGVQVSF